MTQFKAVFLTNGAYNRKGFACLVFDSLEAMYKEANTSGWYLEKFDIVENGRTLQTVGAE